LTVFTQLLSTGPLVEITESKRNWRHGSIIIGVTDLIATRSIRW